jgi:histidinol-phosphate/aromatic aminotransferase/cobyric acid decarboxylase-like protein
VTAVELHGDDYARGARRDFAVNVSVDQRPQWLEDAIAEGVARLGAYPDESAAAAAVAERHRRDPAEVVLLNGAAQAFTLIAQALGAARPAVVHPSFTEPERAFRQAGHAPERVILPPPFELEPALVPAGADCVVVGNPTNPTGVLHPRQAIAALVRPGRTTVVDEAFLDYVAGEPETLSGTRAAGLVILRSLTKILGVPGVRAGYLLAPADLARRIRDARPAWSVNSVALAVIEAACRRAGWLAEQAALTRSRRIALTRRLANIDGLAPLPAAANFLLLEMDDAPAVERRLRGGYGIATRPCWTFPGLDRRHLRVAIRGDPLDAELVGALAAVLHRPIGHTPGRFGPG